MITNIGTQTIDTERLQLRRFALNDATDMFNNWANDDEVCKYLSWYPHATIETTQQTMHNWVNAYENPTVYNWAIVLKSSEQVIGSISVVDLMEKHLCCEIGYCIGKKFWGKGIMTEALAAVNNYMFSRVGINRIQARHDTHNPASGKVMQKAGMQLEGTMRQVKVRKDGSFGDMNIWAILKDEWSEMKK